VSPASFDPAVILSAVLLASVSLVNPTLLRAPCFRIPSWLPFAALIAMCVASLTFGVLDPEAVVAAVFEG
jgi:hypothetical protein